MRIALAVLLAFHGIAHLVGFAVPWRLAKPPGGTYRTTILGGRVNLGAAGIRIYGVLWLLLAIAFLYAAIATVTATDDHLSFHLVLFVTTASLIVSILSLPESRIGVIVNLLILAWLHVGVWLGWFGH